MNLNLNHSARRGWLAFTLIELLVVVGIIAVLAAMLFPAGAAIQRKATIKRVEGELAQLESAIESYKIEKGFYPPDNKVNNNPVFVRPYPNSLYYELGGANYDQGRDEFTTLDGSDVVSADDLFTAFKTRGINNAGMPGNSGGLVAKNYIPDLKPAQSAVVVLVPGGNRKVLGTSVEGPVSAGGITPFRYVSSNPTNNPSTFDLWVDILVGSKTNRISNWSEKPEVVSY